MALANLFKRKASGPPASGRADRGLLVFEHTSEVIRAERLLKESGREIRVMGPPPEIQRGCDLVVEFPLMEKLDILRILDEAGTAPLESVPVTGPLLSPVDLFQVKDFGDHLMVRAANMKLTVDKKTRTIVNVSGGGCPDVPYIAARLIGRTLDEAPAPREIGHTLCGYALELAHAEMVRLCSS
ncbi:hypothetical protein BerOc1_01956 [Pseudodesulfovibrio hydrargyri]|uniref:Uncharacterized protein n=1 Tax=Pseudodesulfovibrio hydrargyri TaxID=2125990 RepID=A0A1J5MVM9_9BACT|nr:DUF3343 domain-containing protein [Pseudodesulfovibrio hydrargyri]OIQ50026.1 hypothetical protein BerOc1_01956 [Pseudodesulfovibrio hydrargyri]